MEQESNWRHQYCEPGQKGYQQERKWRRYQRGGERPTWTGMKS